MGNKTDLGLALLTVVLIVWVSPLFLKEFEKVFKWARRLPSSRERSAMMVAVLLSMLLVLSLDVFVVEEVIRDLSRSRLPTAPCTAGAQGMPLQEGTTQAAVMDLSADEGDRKRRRKWNGFLCQTWRAFLAELSACKSKSELFGRTHFRQCVSRVQRAVSARLRQTAIAAACRA